MQHRNQLLQLSLGSLPLSRLHTAGTWLRSKPLSSGSAGGLELCSARLPPFKQVSLFYFFKNPVQLHVELRSSLRGPLLGELNQKFLRLFHSTL